MKLSFERKIVLGFVLNIAVVLVLGLIYWYRLSNTETVLLDWVVLGLIILSLGMLTVVYFVIRDQLKARRISENKFLESKNLLDSILENSSNPISVKKINGEYLLVNQQYAALFGKPKEEFIGKTDHDIFSKEVADRFRSADLEVVKRDQEMKVEEFIEQTNGTNTFLSVKFPLNDAFNRIFAIGTISTDITDRKATMNSLIAGEKFFEMSMDMLVVANQEKFIKINPAISTALGYAKEELLSQPFTNFIFVEDLEATQKEIEKLQQGISLVNFRNRWVCKDGSVKWFSWTATADVETGLLYAIARDITERLKKEQEENAAVNELYENEQKLSLILENIGDGVMVANTDKQVVLANYRIHEIFNIEEDIKIPAQFSDHFELYYPDEITVFPSQNMPMEKALSGQATDDVDVVLIDPKQQQKMRVLLSGRPIVDQENNVIAGVVTVKDISRYKTMEEELIKSKKELRRAIGFKKEEEELKAENKEEDKKETKK